MKFFAKFGRYCTYAGRKKIQFEKNQFESEDPEVIKVLQNDVNVTVLTPPAAVKKSDKQAEK